MRKLALAFLFAVLAQSAFAATEVVDGIEWTYMIDDGKAIVGGGSASTPAVSVLTTGALAIPATLGGFPVTGIAYGAFYGCSNLVSVSIPAGVTRIGDSAFCYCSGLMSISMPERLTLIDRLAFCHCTSLSSVTIPNGVERIGDKAFLGCSSLSSIVIPDGVQSIGNTTFQGCTGLVSATIPASVKDLGRQTFRYCENLISVTIAEGVENIGTSVFCECGKLPAITIPVTVTNIEAGVFYHCSNLVSVVIPDGVSFIGETTFAGCGKLESVTIPDSVKSIGNRAFWGCPSLTSVAIPAGVTTIGDAAFRSCEALRDITIPQCLTNIGRQAFMYCRSLTSVTIPEGVTILGESVFQNCPSLKSVFLPDGLTSIGDGTFQECNVLETAEIPAAVTNIGSRAFRRCRKLQTVTIPDGVVTINEATFQECDSLETVTVPLAVMTIGANAFSGCKNLKTLWLPVRFRNSPPTVPNGCTIRYYGAPVYLTVRSEFGTPEPTGTNLLYCLGDEVDCRVKLPNLGPGSGDTRLLCKGWTGTGSVPANGTETNLTFVIEEDSTLDWNWEEQVRIECEIDCGLVGIEPVFAVVQTNEAFGNITQGYRTYNYGVSTTNLVPGSVSVKIGGAETLLDNGTGRLVRASASAPSYINYGSGSVNYDTGLVSFYVNSNATEPKSVCISYSSRTETGKRWIVLHETGGGSVWVPRNGQNVEFAFPRTGNAFIWSLEGDTNGVVLGVEGGTVSIPSDEPYSVRLSVIELTPEEVVAANGGDPVSWTATEKWVSVADETSSGGYCMRSAALGAGETAAVTATAEGPGTLSFDWRISSARGHYARFYLDGAKTNELTRSTDWTTETHVLGEGLHEFRWTYEMGTGATGGSDAVFLDNVKWTPAQTIALEEALDATNLVWATDIAAPWTPQTVVSSDGEDSAKSGEVYGGATSRLSTVVTNAGLLAWKWKAEVAGAAGVDVFLDGESLYDAGIYLEGSTDWTLASLEIEGSGEHVVLFEYWNGGTAATISDCAYIDCVSWTPAGGGKDSTVTTPESVPYAWLDEYRLGDGSENGYETAALATAANGVNKVWECYVAGLSPTNASARFEARIEFDAAGKPVVTWTPDLNEGGTKHERAYRILGAKSLGDAEPWNDVTGLADPDAVGYRFFKAKVEMPE